MFSKKEIIVAITITLAVLAAIVGIAIAIASCCEGTFEFDTVSWVANPANPASPVHSILP